MILHATQLGENSNSYPLESSKVKKIFEKSYPHLFNHLSIPIKEIPSIPIANLGNNDKKAIKLF